MSVNSGEPPSRYEINRLVRSVLSRHAVDLEALSISSSASLVYLNGFLKKSMGEDLKPANIDVIFREIERIPWVRGIVTDLENWVVTSSDGAWFAVAKGRSLRRPVAASGGQETYRINTEERIMDVLQDVKEKKEEENSGKKNHSG